MLTSLAWPKNSSLVSVAPTFETVLDLDFEIAPVASTRCVLAVEPNPDSATDLLGDRLVLDAIDDIRPDWSEEDVVWLHWRLLLELQQLPNPYTPLEEKLDTLAWALTEPEQDAKPFSFANCLKVVGTSPLSPTAYFGALDVDDIRSWIRRQAPGWIRLSLARYPQWMRTLIAQQPDWVAQQLSRNPQWVNEQIQEHSPQHRQQHEGPCQPDLFDGFEDEAISAPAGDLATACARGHSCNPCNP